jgi:hypothetical protein
VPITIDWAFCAASAVLRASARSRFQQLGQAEVEKLEPAIPGNEHVLGLHVAMNDAVLVRRTQRARDLPCPRHRETDWEASLIQTHAKRTPVQQFRHHVEQVAVLRDLVHGDDVRMVQARGGQCFLA